MKQRLAVILPWLVGAVVQALAHAEEACQYRDQPVESAPAGKSSITVMATSPAEGGEIDRTTIIGVDVEYRIADFKQGDYFLSAIFPTQNGGMSVGRFDEYPNLTAPAGKAHFCVPLTEVYGHERVRWPLSLIVNLMRREDGVSTKSMASSAPHSFRATDIPAGALERQAAAPPREYQFALMKASGYFKFRAALYKMCIEKFPDRQPAITRTYRAWEAQNRADIDFITQLQFDAYREQFKGHAPTAMRVEDQGTAAIRAGLEGMPIGEFQQQCDWFHDDTPEGAARTHDLISRELDIVRKYAPNAAGGSGE
jgi:hypothetical protein